MKPETTASIPLSNALQIKPQKIPDKQRIHLTIHNQEALPQPQAQH
jgi:hypothetical protein